MLMFCYQCEQTAKGEGCTKLGVCGKEPEVAALQDLLIYALMGLSQYATEGRKVGVSDRDLNVFTVKSMFSTLTNVNFDSDRFVGLINQTVEKREQLKGKSSQQEEKWILPKDLLLSNRQPILMSWFSRGRQWASSLILATTPIFFL